jgi:hypothetical protein
MSLISDLRQRPATLSAAARFTSACGLLYLAGGLLLLVWPDAIQMVFQDPAFAAQERALARLLGLMLAIIGWLYFFGGRSGGRQFVAATVVDRLALVPLVLIPTALAGVFPHVLLTFAVLDPALALVAWWLLARS